MPKGKGYKKTAPKKPRSIFGKIEEAMERRTGSRSMRKKFAAKKKGK